MKTMNNIHQTINDYFADKQEVVIVYLFGSFVSGKVNEQSDVDVAVYFDSKFSADLYHDKILQFSDELNRVFNRQIDIVVLNKAQSFLKFHIIKTGVRIMQRFDEVKTEFEARTMIEYFDFLPIRQRLESAMIKRIKEAQ